MYLELTLVWALAQAPPAKPEPTTTHGFATSTYRAVQDFIVRSARKMPADGFDFQPTPDVRSFAGLLAHVTDANYLLCSYALGEPNPNGSVMNRIEKEKPAREALLGNLQESVTYCDRAYAQLTDATANEQVNFFGDQRRTRLGVLWFHVSHAFEHYGNIVTYLRLKGIVPPSSEPTRPAGG